MTETIFMIHGMWGGPWCWKNYKQFFETKNYRCVTTTLRHHDMDPKDLPDPQLGTTSLIDFAEDLEYEIRQLATKPILMGHSMGGLLAQILGSRGLAKGPRSADPCVACRDYGCDTLCDKKLLGNTDKMGLLEKTNATNAKGFHLRVAAFVAA
jgi:pimeloyl-ACP methyl ester carboxylesterase